jgi:putative transposase
MIEPLHKSLSISRQCELLAVSRSYYYYATSFRPERDTELTMKYEIKRLYLSYPFYGYRRMAVTLNRNGFIASNKLARRLMREMGLHAIYPKPRLSAKASGHQIYPYLLRDIAVIRANQVWATDITYIKQNGAFVYLVAVLDLCSRKVLSWSISNTLDAAFCIQALQEAIDIYGAPEIFNTDQGSQFTSDDFIGLLKSYGIQISMDGKGRALDNVYIERLWRSLKYENIFLNEYKDLKALKGGISYYFKFYNTQRYHQSLNYQTPDEIYRMSGGQDIENGQCRASGM